MHFHIGCLNSSSETDNNIFKLDKTNEYIQQLERDIAGVEVNEPIDKEDNAQTQANWLMNMQKRHCKKK